MNVAHVCCVLCCVLFESIQAKAAYIAERHSERVLDAHVVSERQLRQFQAVWRCHNLWYGPLSFRACEQRLVSASAGSCVAASGFVLAAAEYCCRPCLGSCADVTCRVLLLQATLPLLLLASLAAGCAKLNADQGFDFGWFVSLSRPGGSSGGIDSHRGSDNAGSSDGAPTRSCDVPIAFAASVPLPLWLYAALWLLRLLLGAGRELVWRWGGYAARPLRHHAHWGFVSFRVTRFDVTCFAAVSQPKAPMCACQPSTSVCLVLRVPAADPVYACVCVRVWCAGSDRGARRAAGVLRAGPSQQWRWCLIWRSAQRGGCLVPHAPGRLFGACR